jgi:hypothetical protein
MRIFLGSIRTKACVAGLLVLAVTFFAFVAAGCGLDSEVGDGGTVSTSQTSPSDEGTTTTALSDTTTTVGEVTTTTLPSSDSITVTVYFGKNEKIAAASRVIPKTQQVGAAAMKALLEGPTAAEQQGGIGTTIPEGTTLLGLDIKDHIATVDLSKEYASGGGSASMFMRLAEVVLTLTQFPTVDGVNFKLDGEPIQVLGGEGIIIDHPMTRADYEDMLPAILVESPTFGTAVSSPLQVTGTANVFEAVFGISIVDAAGVEVADQQVKASSGTGTRGTFEAAITFKPSKSGTGSLIAYYNSPKDGSKVVVDEIPIVLEK